MVTALHWCVCHSVNSYASEYVLDCLSIIPVFAFPKAVSEGPVSTNKHGDMHNSMEMWNSSSLKSVPVWFDNCPHPVSHSVVLHLGGHEVETEEDGGRFSH